MRFFISLLLFFSFTYGFEVSVKSGKYESSQYTILTLHSDEIAFGCEEIVDAYMNIIEIQCNFPRGFYDEIDDIRHPLLNLSFTKTRDNFTLSITSSKNMKLFATSKPFYEETILTYFESDTSYNWSVIIFESQLPFITVAQQQGMKFPIPRDFTTLPRVGPVDINSMPVRAGASIDIEQYIRLESIYNGQDYYEALRFSRELMERFPDSIFYSDFLRYEMKSLYGIGIDEYFDDIVELGKVFIRNYTSDEYLPEVLLMMAKSYATTGFLSDANYFFNRLIHEHGDTYFGGMGNIEFALLQYRTGEQTAGIERLLDTFYSTTHIEVATKAADELASIYLATNKRADAIGFISTIWSNNQEYLLSDIAKSLNYADAIASGESDLDLAVEIYEKVLSMLNRHADDLYHEVIFKIGSTYDKMKNYNEAYNYYELYLNDFPYGSYEEDVRDALDMLLIKQDSDDVDEKIANLNELIDKHLDQSVGQKAVVAKLQVLNGEGMFARSIQMYEQVQNLSEEFYEEAATYLDEAFLRHITALLVTHSCVEVDNLMSRYALELDYSLYDNKKLFDCYFESARFTLAKDIATANINDESLQERTYWLCNLAKVNIAQREFAIAKDIYDDIYALNMQNSCPNIDLNLFEIYKQISDVEGMIEVIERIEVVDQSSKLLELYREIIQRSRDESVTRVYVQRMLNHHDNLGVNTYSPWIELQAARHLEPSQNLVEMLENALEVSRGEQKARVYFEIGNMNAKLNNTDAAQQAYDECMEIDSMWRTICRDSKALLD